MYKYGLFAYHNWNCAWVVSSDTLYYWDRCTTQEWEDIGDDVLGNISSSIKALNENRDDSFIFKAPMEFC